jgi:hypothetical protein
LDGKILIKTYLYSFKAEDCSADKWDYGLLKEVFDKYQIEQVRVTSIPKTERAFVVVPGPQNLGYEESVNKEIQNVSRLVLFITGDEEGKFDIEKISHPNAEIWIQYPYEKHNSLNKLPIGVPQHLKKLVPEYPSKPYDLYFSGQITHPRRQQIAKVLPKVPNALFTLTEGFAQGGEPVDYYKALASAKIAPAPSGAATMDTFRFFEAIEMLCLPIADGIDSRGNFIEFYKNLFGYEIPVEVTYNWSNLTKLVPTLLHQYPQNMHKVVSWWIKYKRDLGIKVMRQINE